MKLSSCWHILGMRLVFPALCPLLFQVTFLCISYTLPPNDNDILLPIQMTFLNIFISIINPHESAYFIKLMNQWQIRLQHSLSEINGNRSRHDCIIIVRVHCEGLLDNWQWKLECTVGWMQTDHAWVTQIWTSLSEERKTFWLSGDSGSVLSRCFLAPLGVFFVMKTLENEW